MAFETTVRVRHRDLDTNGHVNNVVFGTYLEEARDRFYRAALDGGLDRLNTVLVRLEVEFERAVSGGTAVAVELTVPDLGTTSITMAYRLRVDGERVASAETVQVFVDEAGDPQPLPDALRETVAAL